MSDVEIKDDTLKVLRDLQHKQLSFVTQGGQLVRTKMIESIVEVGAVDKGFLKNSVETESFVENGIAVSETGATADYAVYIEYGTGIFAKESTAKKIPWTYKRPDGQFITTKGMEARPFAEPGWQKAKAKFPLLLKVLEL